MHFIYIYMDIQKFVFPLIFFNFFFFWNRLSCCLGQIQTHYVVQAALELL